MADAYTSTIQIAGRQRYYRGYVNAYVRSTTDTTATVVAAACMDCRYASLYGAAGEILMNGAWKTSFSGVMNNTGGGWVTFTRSNEVSGTFQRTNVDYQIPVKVNVWGQTVNGYGSAGGSASATVYITIPARTYSAHGNPTIRASKTTANYGESVTISWAKSSTQGNANFDRFELWQGNTKLYSGSAISKSVKPSDVTGAKGGTATYTVKEIHEWYGSYPSTQSSVSITVRSGVVSAYDSTGKKHTGLVTAYDSSGKSHYVLITAYDANGSPHSVV